MTKKTNSTTKASLEGQITRAIDMDLKKSDILLLLKEGKNEEYLNQLGKITADAKSAAIEEEATFTAFKNAIKDLILKKTNLDPYYERLGVKKKDVGVQIDVGFIRYPADTRDRERVKSVFIDGTFDLAVPYNKHFEIQYRIQAIQQVPGTTSVLPVEEIHAKVLNIPFSATITLHTKTETITPAIEVEGVGTIRKSIHPTTHMSLPMELDSLSFAKLPEFKKYREACEKAVITKVNEAMIRTEYVMFTKSDAKMKAAMIKNSLMNDPEGQKILEIVQNASKLNVKLLS